MIRNRSSRRLFCVVLVAKRYLGTSSWRSELVRNALALDDVEIRDAAVQAAELWDDPHILPVLKSHYEPESWLRDYISDVIDDLGGVGDVLGPEDLTRQVGRQRGVVKRRNFGGCGNRGPAHTRGNKLSFWRCGSGREVEVEDAALAIAAASDRVDKLDIVWVDEDELKTDGQTLENTPKGEHMLQN